MLQRVIIRHCAFFTVRRHEFCLGGGAGIA
jgi:hypothetical protein